MRALLAGAATWFVVAQAGQPMPGWDELLKQFVSQAFPVVLGFFVHWLGARFGAKTAAPSLPDSSSTP